MRNHDKIEKLARKHARQWQLPKNIYGMYQSYAHINDRRTTFCPCLERAFQTAFSNGLAQRVKTSAASPPQGRRCGSRVLFWRKFDELSNDMSFVHKSDRCRLVNQYCHIGHRQPPLKQGMRGGSRVLEGPFYCPLSIETENFHKSNEWSTSHNFIC